MQQMMQIANIIKAKNFTILKREKTIFIFVKAAQRSGLNRFFCD